MGLKTLYHKLGKKAVTYGLAGSILLGSLGIGLTGCGDRVSAQSNPGIEQNYTQKKPVYRSPGKPKVDGTNYSLSDSFSGTYVDSHGAQHFKEEQTISTINSDENSVNLGISDSAFNYAESHNCEIGEALIDHVKKDEEIYYPSSVKDKNASIKIPRTIQGKLYAATYCTNRTSGNTEFLASYPVFKSNGSTQVSSEPSVSRAGAPIAPPYIPSGKSAQGPSKPGDIVKTPAKPSTENKIPDTRRNSSQASILPGYKELDSNKEPAYHLRTECGDRDIKTVKSLITNLQLDPKKYGKITIDNTKSCDVYLDESNNKFNNFSIGPKEISNNVLSTSSLDDKRLILDFQAKGIYQLIASTENYPEEKDILIFEVKEIPSSSSKQDIENIVDAFRQVPVGNDPINAYIGQRKFLATARKDVVENPLYKKQKSLNDILKESDGKIIPVDYIHQGDSLEFLVKNEDGLTYKPELWQIKQVAYTNGAFGYVIEKKVNLKQSKLNNHRLKINEKGKLQAENGNLQDKLVKFSYDEVREGPSDGLSGNSYLLTLTGYDENGKVKDLDVVILEVVADLKREFAKGFIIGALIGGSGGYYLGIVDAANPGGLFTVEKGSESVKAGVAGSKTGGTPL